MYNELVAFNDPKCGASEAIRTLRTNLSFTFTDDKIKCIMITSSVPGEGKSFISANLAYAFSLDNKKVLLVDADLRRGRVNKIFNIDKNQGITNMLLGDNKTIKKYIYKTEIDNLDVLPNGTVPPNPSELLNSKKFKDILEKLRSDYDLIILDCPPIGSVTDSLVLTSLADEAVLVCKYKETTMEILTETKRALDNANIKIAGVVINNFKPAKDKYYYYNSYTK